MAYKIKCDDFPILDLRKEELIVLNPRVKLEVNTVGEASFTIYNQHPYYDKLKKKKSIVEVSDEFGVIFRGRITDDTRDFNNGRAIDIEGVMAFFNDSIVRPYSFPNDFLEDADYIASTNKVEFFLKWLVENHNSQVHPFQQLKLGNVTVSDPNNYITRSDSKRSNTWNVLKEKLFESDLGGYLCVRYEADGNYIDYLSEFELTNTQEIKFGENLLDLTHESSAIETYSAIIPIGATTEVPVESENDEGEAETIKVELTLEGIADGDVTDDIVKTKMSNGEHVLYSKKAVEEYGWIFAPVDETTWNDVTNVNNLLSKGVNHLVGKAVMLSDTIELSAVDLHFTDDEIQSFRIYRNVNVVSLPHGLSESYQLTKLDIDILNPQNTTITVGETKLTLIDQNNKEQSTTVQKIETVVKDIEENRTEVTEVKNILSVQQTEIINSCTSVIINALDQYVQTDNFEEFKATVEAQFQVVADEITMSFTNTSEQITNVNGDLQSKWNQLYKFIQFTSDTAITIGSGDSAITLEIDNKTGIVFKKNGVQFGWWDGVDFHTGNIVVDLNERAQFGNFAFVPRSNGSLSLLKVRDYVENTDVVGVILKSSDDYTLKDINGLYLTTKEGE